MPATSDLVNFALSLSLDVAPAAVTRVAKAALLDAIACALAATEERAVAGARSLLGATARGGPCTVWGTPRRAAPHAAAFVNGTAAHALDYDDVNWDMNGHPSAVLAPIVCAAAERYGATGTELLSAFVAGLEVAGRLGAALGRQHYARGFHPTATVGALSGTLAAARLARLPAGVAATALGIACSRAAGTRANFGTDVKPLHAGFAAESALVAVALAEAGVTARRDALEAHMGFFDLYGGGGSGLLRLDTDRFTVLDPGIELKPYPSCRFTHRVIDAIVALRARHPGAVPVSLECTIDPFARKILIYDRATTSLEAKFCMQYAAAAAWLDGPPGLSSFVDTRVAGADVQALASRVTLLDGDESEESVAAQFADGTMDRETVILARGHPARPLHDAERVGKVRACAEPRLGARAASQLIAMVDELESEPDAAALCALLAGTPQEPAR